MGKICYTIVKKGILMPRRKEGLGLIKKLKKNKLGVERK